MTSLRKANTAPTVLYTVAGLPMPGRTAFISDILYFTRQMAPNKMEWNSIATCFLRWWGKGAGEDGFAGQGQSEGALQVDGNREDGSAEDGVEDEVMSDDGV